jgi:DNA-binding MarR family transcriptional regulator
MVPFDPSARTLPRLAPALRGGAAVSTGRRRAADDAGPARTVPSSGAGGPPASPRRPHGSRPAGPGAWNTGADGGLETLRRAVLALVPRSEDDRRDLTLRQVAILLLVYEPGQKPRTAGALADLLGVPRPAITRALDRLGELDLARREYGPSGSRRVRVQRTRRGSALLARLRRRLATASARGVIGLCP